QEAEQGLFFEYEKTLRALLRADSLEPVLRCFEIMLLEALGYGLHFTEEAETGELVQPDGHYHFRPESGFSRVLTAELDSAGSAPGNGVYLGRNLLAMAAQDFEDDSTRKAAKRLLRHVLGVYLGDKPLSSRQLFSAR
ncbi:MAG: DNA repair protein RecO C-terminal domain-containing protein, partial [Pseudomonadales bacterium]|nr:DNA repair protein RecO C-terminal domain-containing protein [Pseudomonadales bacterium]